jgi:hypothetical protein
VVSVRNHLLRIETQSGYPALAGNLYGEIDLSLNDLVGVLSFVTEAGQIDQNR